MALARAGSVTAIGAVMESEDETHHPQHQTSPSASRAHVWEPPADTCKTGPGSGTFKGVTEPGAPPAGPSCPVSSEPQHHTEASGDTRARAWVSPAASAPAPARPGTGSGAAEAENPASTYGDTLPTQDAPPSAHLAQVKSFPLAWDTALIPAPLLIGARTETDANNRRTVLPSSRRGLYPA